MTTKTRKLQPGGDQATIAVSPKGAAVAGRKREIHPDPTSPRGQCALYLEKLMHDRDIDPAKLAKRIKKQRSTIFNYLSGETEPNREAQQLLAKGLGLRDFRDLAPTDEFLTELKSKRK